MSEFAKLNQIIGLIGTVITNQGAIMNAINAIPGTPELQSHIDQVAAQVAAIQASIGSESDGETAAQNVAAANSTAPDSLSEKPDGVDTTEGGAA